MNEAIEFHPLVKIPQAAEELDCAIATIWRKAKAGKIKIVFIGRAARMTREELERLKREGTD